MTMIASFPTLRRVLALFADLDWPVADRLLQSMAAEPGTMPALREELELAVRDPQTDWSSLVANESYELTDADDPGAQELVLHLLWDALNPTAPARNVDHANYRAYSYAAQQSGASVTHHLDVGADLDVRLEDIQKKVELARVSRITRAGNALQVVYEPLQAHPLPSTLLKLLRSALRDLLRDVPALDAITGIEFEEAKSHTKANIGA